jgi:hypothetical protein
MTRPARAAEVATACADANENALTISANDTEQTTKTRRRFVSMEYNTIQLLRA